MEKELKYEPLISKFLSGEISDKELIQLKSWLEESHEHRIIFDRNNEIWRASEVTLNSGIFQPDQGWTNMKQKLKHYKDHGRQLTVIRKKHFRLLLVAASVALLLGVGSSGLWFFGNRSMDRKLNGYTEIRTNNGEKSHVLLPDSTEVFLNAGSTLRYNTNFQMKDRHVLLSGEAYFMVRSDPSNPFTVEVDGINIRAIGTRFNVSSYLDDNRIETTLVEGRISLSSEIQDPMFIETGQQVIFDRDDKTFKVRQVETENYLSWMENRIRFSDTPLDEVIRILQRNYNVIIELESPGLKDLKYTATLIDESIEDVMEMFKSATPINYHIEYLTSFEDKHYIKPHIKIWDINSPSPR